MPTPSRTVRVFLSSTFRDFAEERDLLVRKVFPELRRKCRERQVELVDVDLRWGITEEEAQQGKVLPICLAEIDRSRPYFIGFLGERYGSIPDVDQYDLSLLMEQPWLDEHRGGKSITELEILHGVLNNPDMAGQAFFYFRDPEYSYSKGGDYLSESPEDQVKLDLLKQRIRESGFPVVENYPDPEVLAKRVMDDLWQLIESAYPENKVPDQLDLMKRRHETYSASRQGLYIGGEEYLATLDQIMGSTMHKPVMVTGDSGGGKSTLLANWARSFSHQNPDAFVLEHYLATGADNAEATTMVTRLLREIARFTGEDLLLEGDPRKALYLFHEWLSKAGAFARQQGGKFILVLDGLDKMTGGGGLDWFPRHLPEGVSIVASCLPGLVYDAIATRMAFEQVIVTPFSRTDCEVFIHRYLEKFRKPLPQELVQLVLQHPHCGNPLFLRTLLEEMRIFGVHEQLRQKLEHYLESITIDDLFEKVLERVEADNRPADVKAVLEVLWAAKESFAEDELLEISGVPPAVWAAIHIALDDSLIGDIGRVLFCHDYMRKAVEDRYLATEEDRARIRICMAEFCAHAMQSNRKDISPYVRRNAVVHFLEAQNWDNAAAALSDVEYIEARARTQELSSMLIDYRAALHLLPEGESERQAEDARQAELDRYAREMHDYAATWTRIREGSSEAQPTLPRPVESVGFWSEEEIAAERKRISEAPNRLDILKAFRIFVATNSAPLEKYTAQEGFVANLARNHAPAGPVHEEGGRRLEPLQCVKLIRDFSIEITDDYTESGCETIFEGHVGTINAIAISTDGRRTVTGGDDKTVRVWNNDVGVCEIVLVGHNEAVTSVAVSAQGSMVLSGSYDGTLRLWNIHSGECIKTISDDMRITSVAMTPDGRYAVSAYSDYSLRVWDLFLGECVRIFNGHEGRIVSVAISSDGCRAISGSVDKTLRFWDITSGECLNVIEAHSKEITCVTASANCQKIVTGSWEEELAFWEGEIDNMDGLTITDNEHYYSEHERILRYNLSVSATSDFKIVAAVCGDGSLKLWDVNSAKCLVEFANPDTANKVAIRPDGHFFYINDDKGNIHKWNAEATGNFNMDWDEWENWMFLRKSDRNTAFDEESSHEIFDSGCSISDEFLLKGSEDSTLKLILKETGKCIAKFFLRDLSKDGNDWANSNRLIIGNTSGYGGIKQFDYKGQLRNHRVSLFRLENLDSVRISEK